MKILHIYDGHERVYPGQGSVPTVVYELAKHVAERGHEVVVIERKWNGLCSEDVLDGVKFKRLDLKIGSNVPYTEVPYVQIKSLHGTTRLVVSRCEFAYKAMKLLKDERFDVIHAHLPFAASILVTLRPKLGDRMVYTAHVGEEGKRFGLSASAPLLLKLFSPDVYLMKRVKRVVVLNESLKEKLLTYKGIEAEKIEVIPNGIDVKKFGRFTNDEVEKVKKKYEVDGKLIVMYSGTITPRKGIKTLVRGAEIVVKQGYRDVVFLACGNYNIDRGFYEEIMSYIISKGLKEHVKFTGFIPYKDLLILYSACDIFVLPSFEEGFSCSLAEALASGKPLVGSDVGGTRSMIRGGWNGFLIKPGSEEELAKRLIYLITNPKERDRMGRNSRKLAEEAFDWSKIAEKYIEVYEEVVKE